MSTPLYRNIDLRNTYKGKLGEFLNSYLPVGDKVLTLNISYINSLIEDEETISKPKNFYQEHDCSICSDQGPQRYGVLCGASQLIENLDILFDLHMKNSPNTEFNIFSASEFLQLIPQTDNCTLKGFKRIELRKTMNSNPIAMFETLDKRLSCYEFLSFNKIINKYTKYYILCCDMESSSHSNNGKIVDYLKLLKEKYRVLLMVQDIIIKSSFSNDNLDILNRIIRNIEVIKENVFSLICRRISIFKDKCVLSFILDKHGYDYV